MEETKDPASFLSLTEGEGKLRGGDSGECAD